MCVVFEGSNIQSYTSTSYNHFMFHILSSYLSRVSRVLRSKGLVWTDTDPDVAYYWSHAGRMLRLSHWGFWAENFAGGDGARLGRLPTSGSPGTPRNEIVFIGASIDEIALRKLLDSCLRSCLLCPGARAHRAHLEVWGSNWEMPRPPCRRIHWLNGARSKMGWKQRLRKRSF